MGIGKSYLVREVAKDLNMFVVEINLAQYEPTDIGGMQMPDGDSMKTLKPKWLLSKEEHQSKLDDGYIGVLYFFDELPQAPILNQNIFAQICNEYRVGDYNCLYPLSLYVLAIECQIGLELIKCLCI